MNLNDLLLQFEQDQETKPSILNSPSSINNINNLDSLIDDFFSVPSTSSISLIKETNTLNIDDFDINKFSGLSLNDLANSLIQNNETPKNIEINLLPIKTLSTINHSNTTITTSSTISTTTTTTSNTINNGLESLLINTQLNDILACKGSNILLPTNKQTLLLLNNQHNSSNSNKFINVLFNSFEFDNYCEQNNKLNDEFSFKKQAKSFNNRFKINKIKVFDFNEDNYDYRQKILTKKKKI